MKEPVRTWQVEGFTGHLVFHGFFSDALSSRAVGQLVGEEVIHCGRVTSSSMMCMETMETMVYTVVVQAQKQTDTHLRTLPLKVPSVDQQYQKYFEGF